MRLPIGKQVFERLITEGYLYVDKTRQIYDMVTGNSEQIFISRPRRFGKTLLCWTLDALFSGKRELFEGLEISKTDWGWESYPVIHLDMSDIKTANGVESVDNSLTLQMSDTASKHEISIGEATLPGIMLKRAITEVSVKHNKPVVVIVDEYDKPFLDFHAKPEQAQRVREIMRDYYITLKSNEQYMKFLFMTGISKFSKMGVFSALNHLTDISLNENYGTLFGYTEDELAEYFGEYLEAGAKKLNMPLGEFVEKVRAYYNGFCFDGEHRVYNPFSMLNFLESYKFSNYWMESGTPKMIADYMRDRCLTVEQFRGKQVPDDFVKNPGEIETTPPESFLYQAGYLTLREGVDDDYSLDYPNTEVLNSMSRLVTQNMLSGSGIEFMDLRTPLLRAVGGGNGVLFIETINRLLTSIPYDDYVKSAQQGIRTSGMEITVQEWLYRSNIISFLRGCGVLALGEMHNSKGRSDLLVSHKGTAWIIEIKVAYNDNGKAKAAEAMEQINSRQYADQFVTAKKVGIAIDDKTRRIKEWVAG